MTSQFPSASDVFVSADPQRTQLFLDCDGVLADFDQAAEQIFGMHSHEAKAKLGQQRFWRTLRGQENSYGSLRVLPDARELFDAVAHLHPVILTGCPLGGWAEAQKQGWAAGHFPGTRMVTCMARDKRLYARPGDILVDDMSKFGDLWEEAGGLFVHHTSAQNTVAALRRLHVLTG